MITLLTKMTNQNINETLITRLSQQQRDYWLLIAGIALLAGLCIGCCQAKRVVTAVWAKHVY